MIHMRLIRPLSKAALVLVVFLSACGSEPNAGVAITVDPGSAELAPNSTREFTAVVTGTGNSGVTWSTTGGTVTGEGATVLYTAPSDAGWYELTAISIADSTKRATASIEVKSLALEDVTETVDSEGGTIVTESEESVVLFEPSALVDSTTVRLRTFEHPLDALLGYLTPIGNEVVLDVPVSALELTAGSSIFIGVRGVMPENSDQPTLALVDLIVGNETYYFSAHYHPEHEDAVEISVKDIAEVLELHGGSPEMITIRVQPIAIEDVFSGVDLSSASSAPDVFTVRGLFRYNSTTGRLSDAREICSSRSETAAWAGLSPVHGSAALNIRKTPIVLVHGWQELVVQMARLNSSELGRLKGSYHPAMCSWLDFFGEFSDSSELSEKYELFTYGYQSYLSVEENARRLGAALTTAFGSRPAVVVAHSMGGMVASAHIQSTPEHNVHRLISLGTPYLGSRFILCEASNGTHCTRVRTLLGRLNGALPAIFGAQGTRDLAWAHGGITYNTNRICLFDDSPTVCSNLATTVNNPYLSDLYTDTHPKDYVLYSAVVGMGYYTNTQYSATGDLILTDSGMANDGIVTVQSACLSDYSGVDDNCLYSPLERTQVLFSDANHTSVAGEVTFGLVQRLLEEHWPGDGRPPVTDAPSIAGISPNPVPASLDQQDIVISGSNFVSASIVTLNDGESEFVIPASRVAVHNSQSITIQATLGVEQQDWTVTVANPDSGAVSEPFAFTVRTTTEEGQPGSFTLQPAEPFCTPENTPAIRLTWTPSAGADSYEVHRDGSLYSELETLGTSFENTANVLPATTYSYFVRARNEHGQTDSGITSARALTCADDPLPDGADLLIQELNIAPLAANAGGEVQISFDIFNRGDSASLATTTRVRMNKSAETVTASDLLLLEASTPPIAAADSLHINRTLTLPNSIESGDYYVWVIADALNEGSQSNYDNDFAAVTLTVADESTESKMVVSSGQGHTLAIRPDGTVWTWGAGVLGSSHMPTMVGGLTDMVDVAAGATHSLAVGADGVVWSWGANDLGQLGRDTDNAEDSSPGIVEGLPHVIAVAAGYGFSLALDEDRTVWSWGGNKNGQLGAGLPMRNGIGSLSPVRVLGLTSIVEVSAGNSHTVALRSDGTVWSWGANSAGQIGDGHTGWQNDRSVPIRATGITDAISVAAGNSHSASATESGLVYVWGCHSPNEAFCLDNNMILSPTVFDLVSDVTKIASSARALFALSPDGSVLSWAVENHYLPPELGHEIPGESAIAPVSALNHVSMLEGSLGGQAFAITPDGTLWGWGENSAGQLGDGTFTTRLAPIDVVWPPE